MLRAACFALLLAAPGLASAQTPRLEVEAKPVHLHGPRSCYTLLVTEHLGNGETLDRTTDARFTSAAPGIAKVDARGRIEAVTDGSTRINVRIGTETKSVEVIVKGTQVPTEWHFENDILPVLTRHGCNSSGCHGKAEGQNGFKLSVFGSDAIADHAALTREHRGRRVFIPAAEHSLLLRKAAGQVPHGGGSRIKADTADYVTLRDWIAVGAPLGAKKAPRVVSVRVEPGMRTLRPGSLQQLRVWATWSDLKGEVDVTHHARFQSNNDALASVDAFGLVTASDLPGEATVMASYHNQVAIFRAVLPRAAKIASYPALPANNALDTQVWAKLKLLQVLPSEVCDDATFMRRATLDILGVLPTADEVRKFLADTRPDRRARLVDALLERPEYADLWASKWADLLRVDRQALGAKHAQSFHRWIRSQFAANVPLDVFARGVLTAEGPLGEVPAAAFYKAVRKPGEAASHVSQVFLGVRIACAECHHHPFDRWSQADYIGMQAFFTGVRLEGKDDEAIVGGTAGPSTHPRTGDKVHAHALGQDEPATSPTGDPRPLLAGWVTQPQNPYFARNLANRLWAHFLGRGIVDAVDDVRATNPPTNPELLDELAKHLVANKFDQKALIRYITASRVYQLASKPNETNERDEQNYSRALLRRLPAEVLLDMVSQATGVPEKFEGLAPGARAIQLWDSKYVHYFLKTFGRPLRVTACECERSTEPGVAQVLHLLNAPELQAKLAHPAGTVAKLVRTLPDDAALVEGLYLTFYSRLPTEREREVAAGYLAKRKEQRREAVEDLAWTLLNSLEFVFNH